MASRVDDGAGVLPAPAEKAAAVRRMFGAIAPRYDLLNHLLSLNSDKRWRRRAVDVLLQDARLDGTYLDACAGTLDLAHELARRGEFAGRVLAADFTPEMLERGKSKAEGLPMFPAAGDTLMLPVRDASMDGATVGFGVRNLADLDAGLRELTRVLRPGAKLVILEFTTPSWQPFRGTYLFYFRHVLPRIGRMVSSHGTAYSYLPASVLEFPEPPELADRMRAAGLRDVTWETRSGGIVAIHSGVRA
ncbi:MAG: ubiquinone/menaquinone biosynthesis methyltransferase [Longimicrobiales bacterium]